MLLSLFFFFKYVSQIVSHGTGGGTVAPWKLAQRSTIVMEPCLFIFLGHSFFISGRIPEMKRSSAETNWVWALDVRP